VWALGREDQLRRQTPVWEGQRRRLEEAIPQGVHRALTAEWPQTLKAAMHLQPEEVEMRWPWIYACPGMSRPW
jgi:hypothetical protein